MRTKKILAACLIAAAVVAAGVLLWLNGSFLPRWVTWNRTEEELDLDGDGTAEKLVLKNRRVYITSGDETRYSSPFSWRISDVFARDLDQDGCREIIMLVWKHGSYGPNRPFWVERDTIAFSQHVFIFRYRNEKMSSVWMSSDIGRKINWAYYDENTYLHLIDISDEETVWAWDDWGLVLVEDEPQRETKEPTAEITETETESEGLSAEAEEAVKEVPEEVSENAQNAEEEGKEVPDENKTGTKKSPKTAEKAEEPPEKAEKEAETAPEKPQKGETEAKIDSEKKQEEEAVATPAPAEEEPEEVPEVCHVSLIAVGDNLAHTSVNEQAYDPDKGIFDYSPIYTEIADKISGYDLRIINQETVLISDPMQRSGYPMFATPNTMGDALAEAGFNVVLAATNHSYDAGTRGIEETVKYWKKKHPEILLLGMFNEKQGKRNRGKYYVNHVEVNGIRLALFNFTEMTNGLELPYDYAGGVNTLEDRDELIRLLKKAEKTDDLSICFLHIGEEYTDGPSQEQRRFTEKLTDAGADLIICSHPHVLQGYENLKTEKGKKSIVYWSLGNFMSHQVYADTELGGAATVEIEKKDGKKAIIISWDLLPTVCHFDGEITKVYFLEDYTDELAEKHVINQISELVSVDSLWEKYEKRCGGQS